MNRAFLTKLHLIAAAFMLPAVLMFLTTGALYTWGNKGEWIESTQTVELSQPYAELGESDLSMLGLNTLRENGLPQPSGTKSHSGEGAGQSFTWTGARSETDVAPGPNAMTAEVTIREASMHRWLVQLHKAKGSIWFKAYATLLAAVLALLVFSGVIMGLQVKALRRITVTSSALGAVAFVGFVLMG